MDIEWISQQGKLRLKNNDSVAIGYCGRYLFVMLVDVAEKICNGRLLAGIDNKGKNFAQYWADNCVKKAINEGYVDDHIFLLLFEEQQKLLRYYFLHEIASYLFLTLDTISLRFRCWFTGDCRIGTQHEGKRINWLNTPHRLESSQFTLVQSLNARRFVVPEKIAGRLDKEQYLLLATDGYWCEYLENKQEWEQLEDDSSVLKIKHGCPKLVIKFPVKNIWINYSKKGIDH